MVRVYSLLRKLGRWGLRGLIPVILCVMLMLVAGCGNTVGSGSGGAGGGGAQELNDDPGDPGDPPPPVGPAPEPPDGGDDEPLSAPAEGSISDVLEPGDRFDPVSNKAQSDQLAAEIWATLHESNAQCWISRNGTMQQYQFYEDGSFMSGPLYRYSGMDVSVGQIITHDVGWYNNPSYARPFQAAIIETWSGDLEFLVIQDNQTIVHAVFFGNSLLATFYDAGTNCL